MKRYAGPIALLASFLAFVGPAPAGAAPITFVGSGSGLSASATFNVTGSNLSITLTNTDPTVFTATHGPAALQPSEVLMALFFNVTGVPPLSPLSMTASSVVNGSGTPGQNWQYLGNLVGAPGSASEGVSAAGFGLFGPSGNFAPGGQNLDGADWGIVGPNYAPGSGVGMLQHAPLIQSTATFLLSGLPVGFDPSAGVANVSFQYGTSLRETNLPGDPSTPPVVPEPASLSLLATGLALAARKRLGRFLPLGRHAGPADGAAR